MVVVDQARLAELYQKTLEIEKDMALESEEHRRQTRNIRIKLEKENQEIRALRQSRRAGLEECATSIFRWLTDFAQNPKGKKILLILGEVTIFRGLYHNRKPSEQKDYEARLTYDAHGVLQYREFYRGILTRQTRVLTNPEQMVERLHPNFILSAWEAIAAGKVWEELAYAIKWRAEIFDIRRQRGWWPPQAVEQKHKSR